MINLIKADLYKMYRLSTVKILLFLSFLSAVIVMLSSHLITVGELSLESADFISFFVDPQMVTLLGCVGAGIVVASDFEQKVIEKAITSGKSRLVVVLNKTVIIAILVFLIVFPYIITTIFASSIDREFFDFIPTVFLTIASNETSFLNSLPVLLTVTINYIGQLSISILFLFLVKKPIYVMAFSYGTVLLLGPIASLNQHLSTIASYTPFGVNYSALISGNFEELLSSILISLAFTLVITFLSYIIFRMQEIK